MTTVKVRRRIRDRISLNFSKLNDTFTLFESFDMTSFMLNGGLEMNQPQVHVVFYFFKRLTGGGGCGGGGGGNVLERMNPRGEKVFFD